MKQNPSKGEAAPVPKALNDFTRHKEGANKRSSFLREDSLDIDDGDCKGKEELVIEAPEKGLPQNVDSADNVVDSSEIDPFSPRIPDIPEIPLSQSLKKQDSTNIQTEFNPSSPVSTVFKTTKIFNFV